MQKFVLFDVLTVVLLAEAMHFPDTLDLPNSFYRDQRNFPFTTSFLRKLHQKQSTLAPQTAYIAPNLSPEVEELIKEMEIREAGGVDRSRRSAEIRGYACRFKFCRIYDE